MRAMVIPIGRMVHFGNASGNPEVPIAPTTLLSGNKGVLAACRREAEARLPKMVY